MTKRIWYLYLCFVLAYLSLTLLIPLEAETLRRYELTTAQANLLKLTIAVPMIAIWFAAFYGYSKFRQYAKTISEESDGRAFGHIAGGLGLLAISLPITSILSSLLDYFTRDSGRGIAAATITENYVAILFSLAAFWLVYKGSQELIWLVTDDPRHLARHNLIVMATALLTAFFTHFTLVNPNRRVPTDAAEEAAFYLSDWLIFFTIIIPYMFIWFIGLQAALNIMRYANSVKGVLYRKLLGYLALGTVAIILFTISLQFLKDFAHVFRELSLAPLLAIVYLLLVAMAAGYTFVATGAKKLQKIEEV